MSLCRATNAKAAVEALRGAAGGSLDRGVVDAILAHLDGESRRGQQAFKDGVEVGRAEVRREMRKLLGIKEDGNG